MHKSDSTQTTSRAFFLLTTSSYYYHHHCPRFANNCTLGTILTRVSVTHHLHSNACGKVKGNGSIIICLTTPTFSMSSRIAIPLSSLRSAAYPQLKITSPWHYQLSQPGYMHSSPEAVVSYERIPTSETAGLKR